ncbi:uncharacterized protein PFL1_00235 [Pseudozyma flocculosa PF-1]|uniref:Uncharacterized protein n=1 Tax=Pseudozyma flocculosa TaxID=84751 RepID=A0A5C3EU12_9BASI|nr:uncharacterized protein PFL1_00235 [Pseudozyma flocculosa PF-1]EPQ32037.1 hypothetical protein PFL1_00235 [Pseudozyma flocculosa PF-1]SPO35036.1 uncharacterized protein PSFLO_00507 [Pseudozyma flocculosa]
MVSPRRSAAFLPLLLVALLVLVLQASPAKADNPDSAWGWSTIKPASGSEQVTVPVRGSSASILTLMDSSYTASKIKTVLIQVHGHGRDPWNYYNHNTAARSKAESSLGVDPSTVLSIAPFFMGIGDKNNGAIPEGNPSNWLCFEGDYWAGGYSNLCPDGVQGVSSFEAMDALVAWASNRSRFPNVDRVVISGHSLGGQFVQRYAHFGRPSTSAELHFWVGNAASFLYYSKDRPVPLADLTACKAYNRYLYGSAALSDRLGAYGVGDIGAAQSTYNSRNVHLGIGLQDHAAGVLGCEAKVQGSGHYERATGYINYLRQFKGGFPSRHTVDYVTSSHDARTMLTKKVTLQRLFTDYYAKGIKTPSTLPNGSINNGVQSTFART